MEIVILCGIVLVIALQVLLILKKGQDNSKDFENILNNIQSLSERLDCRQHEHNTESKECQ